MKNKEYTLSNRVGHDPVDWKLVSDADCTTIDKIVARAKKMFKLSKMNATNIEMDIKATHIVNPLRLEDFLNGDDFNFGHDIVGIEKHINRETGELDDFFSPRFSIIEDGMKLIFIDTENKTVREVNTRGELEDLQALVGGLIEPLPVAPDDRHLILVDEEALLKEDQRGEFTFDGYGPYKGSAVVVGCDSEGNTISPTFDIESIRAGVKFI